MKKTQRNFLSYYFGGLFGESTGGDVQPYKFGGKELERTAGIDWYDFGARQYDPVTMRWDRMDQLCEKYYNISPYVYCGGDPVNRIDPDGRFWGDYLTSEGGLIGSDGINDGRLYVLKTSRTEFDSYDNAPIFGITSEEEEWVIQNHDISNKDYFVEITGSKKIREAVVSKIEDDGKGGTTEKNNREYLITFDKSINPNTTDEIYLKRGEVGNLKTDELVSIEHGSSPDLVYIHTHPSGQTETKRWYQAPSKLDVDKTTAQEYVIGMGDKTVYIYNGKGINATLP